MSPRANPKPLTIGVIGMSSLSPELTEFHNKGHIVGPFDCVSSPDVVIGPRCWRIDPALGHLDKQLEMMVSGVRNIKYPKAKEVKDAS